MHHWADRVLIAGNGGFVAKYMGDGVLAYFGYPQAHEHDAERAVRAGLAIVEAAPKLETAAGAPLHVRVGIATGIVVVGDLWARERRRSVASSATRRTSPPGCKGSPSPTASSSPRARARLLGEPVRTCRSRPAETSRASPDRRAHSRR